jgi:D-serine deaminase-like pyridoxal phosphate-dependent protein
MKANSLNDLKLETPAAIIDVEKMRNNITTMQTRMNALGVTFALVRQLH